ncbi:MAG TPA: DUF3772 domain-containing protein, partial [Thermohalobaculum sp.]|nr:DUF3772 domain-containing protein [Thermohalobaculum sp.]
MRWITHLLLIAAVLTAVPQPTLGQTAEGTTETPALVLDRWDAEAALVEQILDEQPVVSGEIEGIRAALEAQRSAVPGLVGAAEAELAPLRSQLEALGAAPEDGAEEAPEIAAERARLTEKIAAIEARLKRAGQAGARAAALLSRLSELRRKLFTQEMLTRGPSIFQTGAIGDAFGSIGQVAATIHAETSERLAASTMDTRFYVRMLVPLLLVAAAVLLMLKVKRATLAWLMRTSETPRRAGPLAGLTVSLVRLLMPAAALLMVVFAVWNSRLLGPHGEVLLTGLASGTLVVIVAYALGGAFYSPHFAELRLSGLADEDATAASRWLIGLAAVVGLDLVLIEQGRNLGLSIEGLEFLNTVLICGGGVALWFFAGFLWMPATESAPAAPGEEAEPAAEPPEIAIGPALAAAAMVVARAVSVVAPALALIGYFAASRHLFYPVVQSGAVIGICVLLFSRVRDIIDRVSDHGETAEAAPSRVQLIPVVVGFLLICAATPVLALVWGADLTDLSSAWRLFAEGFRVGDITISPVDFLWFLVVFSIGLLATRLVQGVLSRSVLPVTGLDAGGRAAVRAGVGYVGILLASLVAISATGLDLSNLAIVAGALSVGIGFGLQNIVNNFVSGIILLIERPIKAGDWVELGSGSGYVKRINVRSTEIQTFDRASLIVPNSELISGPVTNWTHTDLNGRLIVPVGVAYGTDPKRV